MVPTNEQPPMNPFVPSLPMQRPQYPANNMPSSGGFYNAAPSFYADRPMQQQSLNSPNNMPWSGGFSAASRPSFHNGTSFHGGSPFYGGQAFHSGPVYQGMAPNLHLQNQYRPPSSGPKRNRRKDRFRKAELPKPYDYKHESSGAVVYDRSTGVHPAMGPIDANNNPRIGKPLNALRKLSTKSQMKVVGLRIGILCGLLKIHPRPPLFILQRVAYRWPKSYYVEKLNKPSTMATGSQIPTPASAPSASTSDRAISTAPAAPTSSPYEETSEKTLVQEITKPVRIEDDDDFDTISLGSED